MVSFTRTNYRLAEIVKLRDKNQLVLTPKFQRRLIWSYDARSYLMDTIVRGFPMPKIFLREIVRPETELSAYEVVDGQQRLRAILDFYDGVLTLSKRHNPELGDVTFSGLPDTLQRRFLGYELSTEVMEEATDPDVWQMFERLNSNTYTLTRQERLNAEWFGYFKQTAYMLAAEQTSLDAWRDLRIFGNQQIARMKEVELTSDVLVAIIDGISDIAEIATAYEKYDKEFPKKDSAIQAFRASIRSIASGLQEPIKKTRFRNKAWFYSLMIAVADAQGGIPSGKGPKTMRQPSELHRRLFSVDAVLRSLEPPQRLGPLQAALSRGTSHAPQRKVRHEYFFDMLTLSERNWNEKWELLTSST